MSPERRSRLLAAVTLLPLLTTISCATTTTTSATSCARSSGWARYGRVASIREVVQRAEPNPAGGPFAGPLVGGLLFHGRAPVSLVGAVGGAAVAAALSQGSSETRAYQVLVRFEDGRYGVFVYRGHSPFRSGDRVTLTAQGLSEA